MNCNCIFLVWTLTQDQTQQFCDEEAVYESIMSNCNTNCTQKKKTNLNKELAIEAKKVNEDLDYKSEFITEKLKYMGKIWERAGHPMSVDTYDQKFDWWLVRNLKCKFHHVHDQKFRHSSHKYQTFHTIYPILMNVLNKEENKSLKDFILGDVRTDFKFTDEYREAKQEFSIYHGQEISRTEKNCNIEFDNFWTCADAVFKYALACENEEDQRMPARDPFRM